jgi:hypothetical protein
MIGNGLSGSWDSPRPGRMPMGGQRRAVVTLEPDEQELAILRELVAGAARLGHPLPAALAAWLSVCNGAAIGPGGVFGQRPDERFLDIVSVRERHPGWRRQGWIPVAGDGCGNYYVLTQAARSRSSTP